MGYFFPDSFWWPSRGKSGGVGVPRWVGARQPAGGVQPGSTAGKALAELFSEHVKANIDKRRASPVSAGDATDDLLNTAIDGQVFSDDEIVSILRNWAGVALEELHARTKHIEPAGGAPQRDVYSSNGFAALHLRVS
jgi:hypothetical protein